MLRHACRALALVVLVAGTAHAAPATVGELRGVISFKGAAPAREPVRRDSDPVCAATPQLAEDVIVTKGKLAGVLVRIKNGTFGPPPPPSAQLAPAVLTQTACAYRPRVLGVLVGQPLAIDNGDPTYHNVRGVQADRTVFNDSQAAGAPRLLKQAVGAAGEVLRLRCDVHPWMAAYVVVHDHPYFAVTGEDGAFTLQGVPPGRYVVEAWHPVLGLRTTKVTVRAGKRTKANLAFKPKR